jgi:hypothetical protein
VWQGTYTVDVAGQIKTVNHRQGGTTVFYFFAGVQLSCIAEKETCPRRRMSLVFFHF